LDSTNRLSHVLSRQPVSLVSFRSLIVKSILLILGRLWTDLEKKLRDNSLPLDLELMIDFKT